jgi:hypothetical protein
VNGQSGQTFTSALGKLPTPPQLAESRHLARNNSQTHDHERHQGGIEDKWLTDGQENLLTTIKNPFASIPGISRSLGTEGIAFRWRLSGGQTAGVLIVGS